jgi:hypothetical protein
MRLFLLTLAVVAVVPFAAIAHVARHLPPVPVVTVAQ